MFQSALAFIVTFCVGLLIHTYFICKAGYEKVRTAAQIEVLTAQADHAENVIGAQIYQDRVRGLENSWQIYQDAQGYQEPDESSEDFMDRMKSARAAFENMYHELDETVVAEFEPIED